MATELKYFDRIDELTTVTGVGEYVLDGVREGYVSFGSAFSDGDLFTYVVSLASNYEVGIGAYDASANSVTRNTVLRSSNGDAAVNWVVGQKDIAVTMTQDVVSGDSYWDGSEIIKMHGARGAGGDQVFFENDQNVTTDYTITSGKNAISAGDITVVSGVTVTVPSGSKWTIV